MEDTIARHSNWIKNGTKKIQVIGQTILEVFERQILRKGLKGKEMPIDMFLGERGRGKRVVTKNLEKEAIETVLDQSYRKTETSIRKKLARETIRRRVIIKGAEAEELEKTKFHQQECAKDIRDAKSAEDSYGKSKKEQKRSILAAILHLKIFYFMADGVGVETTGGNGKRECKVGAFLRQTGDMIEEIGTFCTWQRIEAFKNMLEWQLLGIFQKIYPIVIISDGAKWIRNLRTKIPCLKNAKWILDWFHLKDHLLQMLRVLNLDENSVQARQFLAMLWLGNRNLDLKKTLPFSADEEERLIQIFAIEKFEKYMENQKEGIINYHAYQMKGHLVGSGYIEKKNDILIKNRMVRQKRMIWSPQGGEAMMQLLAAKMNGRLNELFV